MNGVSVVRSYGIGILSVTASGNSPDEACLASGFDPVEVIGSDGASYVLCRAGSYPSRMEASMADSDDFRSLVAAVKENGSDDFRSRLELLVSIFSGSVSAEVSRSGV